MLCHVNPGIIGTHLYGIPLFRKHRSDEGVRPVQVGKFKAYQPIILYRKFNADQIFTGHEILAGNQVLITDNTGVVMDIIDEHAAGDEIETFTGILTPGFINCHCHLELSHMKSLIPKHTGLVDFVLKVVNERHFEEEEILAAIENAENEMLQNGIVAVGDICNNMFTIGQKTRGNLLYHNFIEASGFPPVVAATRFQRAVDLYNTYAASLPINSIVPHAPYSVSPEMFELINDYPGNHILTIHNQEIPDENKLFETGGGDLIRMYEKMGIDISFFRPSGSSSLQTWLPFFKKEQSIILVHNVATSEADIEFTKPAYRTGRLRTSNLKPQTYFCLCPNANLYITNTLPDVNALIKYDCSVVLGTDSLASNDQLSILEEISTLMKHFPGLQLKTVLQWATINGARALGIENMVGSFEKGKKPGVVLIKQNNESEMLQAERII